MITLDLTETQAMSVLRAFLLGVLPAGTEVVQGQVNRVAEPAGSNFVVFTPLSRKRLATNRTDYADAQITGSILGDTLTVTSVEYGAVRVGAPVFSTTPGAVLHGTSVTAFLTGSGGPGSYRVSRPQTVAAGTLYAGVTRAQQDTALTVQIDVHGPEGGDNVQVITTLFRDRYACDEFASSGLAIQPLYTSEPNQMPFRNGENQIEWRWTTDAVLEIRPIVQRPQEFADAVAVGLSLVD